MWSYRVIRPTVVPGGTVLYLSPQQLCSRRHGLKPLPETGGFQSIKELSFKAGEVLGFDVLPKRLLKNLEAMDEKEEPPSAVEAENRVRLTVPLALTFLEHIAWQLVQTEGSLTIKAYQKQCRRVGRRRLQKVIKGLVDKQILVREGEGHHRCYRFGEKGCR